MSFNEIASTLNQPLLVTSLGIGLWTIGIPYLRQQNLSYEQLRYLNAICYGINFISTSIPGRIDGQQAQELSSGVKTPDGSSASAMSPTRGKTLVAPSGWAFAIWAPIFLGELVHVIEQFWVPSNSKLAKLIKDTSIPFSAAQLFQSLWCASFRPKYKKSWMFVSTAMLSSIALSLREGHSIYTNPSRRHDYTFVEYCIHFLPMTLHFGWTTAATLVNFNGSVAAQGSDVATNKVMAGVGHASAVSATLVGIYTTITQNAPVYGSVISWALTAVGDSIQKRLANAKKDDDITLIFGAQPQYYISIGGAILCAMTSLVVALKGNKQ